MKHLLLLLTFALLNHSAHAQFNLVPNPSFEDTLNCDSFHYMYSGEPWFTPTNCTPDYYYGLNPVCGNSALQNPSGYQLPNDGFAYVGLFVAYPIFSNNSSTREYICSRLIDSLRCNKDYYLEFYVSRANEFYLATDDIGAYFSTQIPVNTGCSVLPLQPQVENPQGNIITDSLSWTKISGIFTAQGGEQYITIGNFKDSINTTIVDADNGNGNNNNAYYYIDKVSLLPLDSLQGISDDHLVITSLHVFPNPISAGSALQVVSELPFECAYSFFSIDGKLQKEGVLLPGNNMLETIYTNAGVYVLSIRTNKEVMTFKIITY